MKRLGVSLASFYWWASFLPVFGMLSTALVSVLVHFEESTATHCQVFNFLPSISASVGGNMPEKFIWRTCIALSIPLFIVDPVLQWNWMPASSARVIAVTLKAMSCVGLTLLTFVGSTEYYPVHKLGFFMWSVGGLLHQAVFLIWWRVDGLQRSNSSAAVTDQVTSFLERYLFLCLCSLVGAGVAFTLHGSYCLPFAYSAFALCEWAFVIGYSIGVSHGSAKALGYLGGRMTVHPASNDPGTV